MADECLTPPGGDFRAHPPQQLLCTAEATANSDAGLPAGTATATAAASATVGHTVAAAGQWESSRGALEEMALTMRGSDGHCWLKYGQKQLSRQRHIIRCYYRCASHRSAACPVKKVVDTDMRPPVSPASISVSYSGGCHTHPQPLRPQPLHLPQQEANEQSVMQPVPPPTSPSRTAAAATRTPSCCTCGRRVSAMRWG
ncbi:hypothetical protein CLOM_g9088 [Closterium sp. NIES-68]|nr:hypothetical protein CLOM_g9088 [Closterium sp. NIES-68]